MKKLLNCTLLTLLATAALTTAAPDKATLVAKEKAIWQAVKTQNAADFQKLLSPQIMYIDSAGIYNLEEQVRDLAKIKMKSFALRDFKLVMTNADTAILTYKGKATVTGDGKDMSSSFNAGSVWQMQNGEWRAIFHSNTEAAASGH